MNLSLWRERTHADAHTKIVQGGGVGEYSPESVLAKARKLAWQEGDVWRVTVDLPAETSIEYKYVCVSFLPSLPL